jgi:MarR family
MKAPSSAGKSFVVENVLKLFPPSAYYSLSAMSERALVYSDEHLKNRFLVLFEAAGLRGAMASYLVRSLLSEGKLRYETVEKTKSGLKPKLIEREGPTGLLTTTTWLSLHPENETRLLSIPVTDTPEQTRNIFLALAANTSTNEIDYEPWHALQAWLDLAEHRAVIPYARRLVEEIPPLAVRLRRDVGTLLTLIRTHAVLHQATRRRDPEGPVIAEMTDYTAVRALIADLIADGVGATVTREIRETVAAVQELGAGDRPVSLVELARRLKLDKSAVSRRVAKAIEHGYLCNQEKTKGKPAKLVIGDSLPDEAPVLPDPAVLGRCTVASVDQATVIHPPSPHPDQIHRRAIL